MLLALLAFIAPALAHGTFFGTVLSVESAKGEVIVARDKSATEPALTAAYHVDHATLAKLAAGDRVRAVEDEHTTPTTLQDVMIASSGSVLSGAPLSPIREVKQSAIGDHVPTTTLVDQDGKPFTLARYIGQDIVIGFIYTRCRDPRECPLTTAKFGQLQTLYAKRDVHLLEVTLDPQFDTPAVLKAYAKKFSADPTRWTFAGGTQENVLNFDSAFGLNPFTDPNVGIIHGETMAIIDKTGVIRDLIYTNSWSSDQITAELDKSDGLSSNLFARFDLWLSDKAVSVCGNDVAGFDGFTDLMIILVILGAVGWLLWRLYRALGPSVR